MAGRSDLDISLSEPDFKTEDRQFGPYALGRQIGAGGMGIVYEALDVEKNKKVAIKVIRDTYGASPVMLCRFTIETEAAARLNHPNIVKVHEVGETNGHPWFTMDLISGESLSAKLSKRAFPFDWENSQGETSQERLKTIVRFVVKVARAVHHAHERGVLHRDLKPGNILIDSKGEPHLTDFGLAKILQADEQRPMLTSAANFPGTPNYMSPEQVSGHETTRASDIYGLGAVLYELLTGGTPFRGQTPLETFKKIAEQEPVRPTRLNPVVPTDLETICLKCLEKDPTRRYISASELAADLENWLHGRPVKARPPSVARRLSRWTQRNRIGAALIVTLCIGLSVSLVLLKKVKEQSDEIRDVANVTVEESMMKIDQLWQDPKMQEVTLSARELAYVDGRSPASLNRAKRQFTLGIATTAQPSEIAFRYAKWLGQLQSELGKVLGEPVAFQLKLFKRFNPNSESLARGDADVLLMSPVEYLEVKEQVPGVAPIAREAMVRESVIFAHTNSGAQQLSELAGKSIALTDPRQTLTIWAKARLFNAGLSAAKMGIVTNIVDREIQSAGTIVSVNETVRRVLKTQSAAGVTYRKRFELYKYRGLVMIDKFPAIAKMLAAREGLDPKVVEGLRQVIHVLKASTNFEAAASDPPQAMIAVDDSYFEDLRKAMKDAARFDGSP
jgi:serine/threonine protein kinase